jgi:stress response protein YsnF
MEHKDEQVVPVVHEELHADTVPVKTGGVRITKRIEGHDEILEQELRKGRVQVKRVKTDRVVDGPQQVQHVGNTVIVPVVSERLRIEKEWVVTEEIHITRLEERETVEQKVRVNEEHAHVERLDEHGNAIASMEPPAQDRISSASAPRSIITPQTDIPSARTRAREEGASSKPHSILKDKPHRAKADRKHTDAHL